MKKNIFILTILSVLALSLTASAAYVYENDEGDYKADVDKFIPQKGIKVKNSKLADMMENSTRNAMEGNKSVKQNSPQLFQSQTPKVNETNPNRKSYKWF